MTTDITPAPAGRFIIYSGHDDRARLDVRFDGETVWLTQAQMADLLMTSRENIALHIGNIYEEGELVRESTCKEFLQVRQEGTRTVAREVLHYDLDMIISVGYRVKSLVATRFRVWATQVLREYITKGFVLDDERLKQPGGIDYFDELNRRIRAIRASEKRFYQKVRDLFKQTSVDYEASSDTAKTFYATIQNKLLFAVTGYTAAELVTARCSADLPNFGLTTWPAERPHKADAMVAKNYLTTSEVTQLDRLVEQFLAFAEGQAERRLVTSMCEWVEATDALLKTNRYSLLPGSGSVSRAALETKVSQTWKRYSKKQRGLDRQKAIETEADDLKALMAAQRQVEKGQTGNEPSPAR